MAATETKAAVKLTNILYLTDFSEPSEAALLFATALGRGYGAKVHALHVLLPVAYAYMTPGLTTLAVEAAEEEAQVEMQRVESHLAGLEHRTLVERGIERFRQARAAHLPTCHPRYFLPWRELWNHFACLAVLCLRYLRSGPLAILSKLCPPHNLSHLDSTARRFIQTLPTNELRCIEAYAEER